MNFQAIREGFNDGMDISRMAIQATYKNDARSDMFLRVGVALHVGVMSAAAAFAFAAHHPFIAAVCATVAAGQVLSYALIKYQLK